MSDPIGNSHWSVQGVERADGIRSPKPVRLNRDADAVRVEVPENIQQLKSQSGKTAREWRIATRKAFTYYFGNGYQLSGFHLMSRTPGSRIPYYQLVRKA
jgi:predicted GNAT superfamily acetyltransferase